MLVRVVCIIVSTERNPTKRSRSRDTESGRFVTEYPHTLFLQAIKDEEGLAATGDIARHVGCSHDTAYKRLTSMENQGFVIRRRFGQTLAWKTTSNAE